MKGKDMILLISTFLMGMFAGAYFYVSVFIPSYGETLKGGTTDANSFLIEGEMYGLCEEDGMCASFQLVNGRTYHYLPYEGGDIEEGTLPVAYKRVLEEALTHESLSYYARTGATGACDDTEYRYTITLAREEYILDTCATLLAVDEALQENLLAVWYALENPDAEPPQAPLPSFDIGDFIFDRFHQGGE